MLLVQQVSTLDCICTSTYTTVPDFTWMLDDGSLQPALRYLIPVVCHACRVGLFRCAACGKEVPRHLVGGALEEPCKCPEATCGKARTMQLMHNLGEYSDKQHIKMQVCHDAIPSPMLSQYMLVPWSMLAQRCSHIDMCSGKPHMQHQPAATSSAILQLHMVAITCSVTQCNHAGKSKCHS